MAVKRKDKFVPVVVGHMPIEISKFTKFFLNYGGRTEAKIFSSQYKPSLIPPGGLEILFVVEFLIFEDKSVLLKHLQNLIELRRVNIDGYTTNEVIVKGKLR